jgi:hypothetical protein
MLPAKRIEALLKRYALYGPDVRVAPVYELPVPIVDVSAQVLHLQRAARFEEPNGCVGVFLPVNYTHYQHPLKDIIEVVLLEHSSFDEIGECALDE